MNKNIFNVIGGIVGVVAIILVGVSLIIGKQPINISVPNGEVPINVNVPDNTDKLIGLSNQYDGYVITKTVTNSSIATTSPIHGLDITNAITGDLYIDNIVISSDTTGLSTTTPMSNNCSGIKITTDGTALTSYYGSTTIMAVNSLPELQANETLDFTSASSSQKIRMKEGSNLQVLPLGNFPCNGAGITTFTMFFKKVTAGSRIVE